MGPMYFRGRRNLRNRDLSDLKHEVEQAHGRRPEPTPMQAKAYRIIRQEAGGGTKTEICIVDGAQSPRLIRGGFSHYDPWKSTWTNCSETCKSSYPHEYNIGRIEVGRDWLAERNLIHMVVDWVRGTTQSPVWKRRLGPDPVELDRQAARHTVEDEQLKKEIQRNKARMRRREEKVRQANPEYRQMSLF